MQSLVLLLDIQDFMLPCLNKKLFGIDCPGCGIQRAIVLLFQGNFSGAFKMYPAIYSLGVLLMLVIFNFFHKFKYDYRIKIGLLIFNAVIIITSYIIKMNHLTS